MEVAQADIQKHLSKTYAVVLRKGRQDATTRLEVFSDVLRDRQRARLSGLVEWGYRRDGLLEVLKIWFVKYNKPVYYQPKEFHEILRAAKHIIIPRKERPDFLDDVKEFLKRIQAPEPRILPVCEHCLREGRLTILTRRNAVKISANQVSCITCAQGDLRTDLKSLGIKLSQGMIRQLERQVSRVKSVPRILHMMTPGFDPVSEPDLTLFDTVEAIDFTEARGLEDLEIPESFKELLQDEGFHQLLPVQDEVVSAGLLDNKDLLIVSSTSSGKTLIGEMGGIPKAMNGLKMVYLSPLVALTNEKYELFRRRYKRLGLRTGIKVGMSRLDVGKEGKPIVDTDIKKAQIVCATYEALDYIFRSGNTEELGNVGTIIIDEIQNLAEPERGPELDGLITRMRYHAPKAQVLALSATVGSPDKLAKELRLKLVEHSGRPIPLERHLVFARSDDEKRSIIRRLVLNEFRNVSKSGNKGQSIIFTYSRRRAHALSDWLREHRVRATVYHGGLSYSRRRSVESLYAKQKYACVVTTAALGAGVDLPASQVIFESLAMGADWLSTAEFEQMLGRAGRLGKHDRGKVYLLVQPEKKYHSGQDRTEDEIAVEILQGIVEDVEPFADSEESSEQMLANICSTGPAGLKDVARMYLKMLSPSIAPSDALKFLIRRHMIRVKQGGVHPSELGRATSLSFLTPTEGLNIFKKTNDMDVLDVAVSLEPFENVYLSSKLQGEINAAFRTYMPTRLFSGVFTDLGDLARKDGGASRLPGWVFEVFSKWTDAFFNCNCSLYPECDHGKIALGRWLVEKRKAGYNPTGLSEELLKQFHLWAYPGDLFSWLDSLIHNLKAVQRIASVAGKIDLGVEIEDQIALIERPLADTKSIEESAEEEEKGV